MRLNNLKGIKHLVQAQHPHISSTKSKAWFCFRASATALGIALAAERGGGRFCLAFPFPSSARNINEPEPGAGGRAAQCPAARGRSRRGILACKPRAGAGQAGSPRARTWQPAGTKRRVPEHPGSSLRNAAVQQVGLWQPFLPQSWASSSSPLMREARVRKRGSFLH